MLLHVIESPFFIAEARVGDGDLAAAIALCGVGFTEAMGLVNQPDKLGARAKAILKDRAEEEIEAAKTEMFVYLLDAFQGPRVKKEQENGRAAGAPFLLSVKLTLMGELGYSEEEALSMPLKKALWEHVGWLDRAGQMRMRNEVDQARHERVMALCARVKAAHEAQKDKHGPDAQS